jgi:5-methylcytosine-specific restriction enzyme subunit McrC
LSLRTHTKKPDPQRTFLHLTPYEKDHVVHQILGAGDSGIVEQFSGITYTANAKNHQLDFPEVKPILANEVTFSKIPKSGKNAPYKMP